MIAMITNVSYQADYSPTTHMISEVAYDLSTLSIYGCLFFLVRVTIQNASLAAEMVGESDAARNVRVRTILLGLFIYLSIACIVCEVLKGVLNCVSWACIYLLSLAAVMVAMIFIALRFLYKVRKLSVQALFCTCAWACACLCVYCLCVCVLVTCLCTLFRVQRILRHSVHVPLIQPPSIIAIHFSALSPPRHDRKQRHCVHQRGRPREAVHAVHDNCLHLWRRLCRISNAEISWVLAGFLQSNFCFFHTGSSWRFRRIHTDFDCVLRNWHVVLVEETRLWRSECGISNSRGRRRRSWSAALAEPAAYAHVTKAPIHDTQWESNAARRARWQHEFIRLCVF